MSSAHLLVVLVAVALLAAFHLTFAGSTRVTGQAHELAPGRDAWTALLVAGAVAAILFALGVVAVPALFDGDDSDTAPTRPTVTIPTGTNGRGATSVERTTTTAPTTTTEPTTTAPTTTAPTTTTRPEPPPRGAVVLARAMVDGARGRLRGGVNRLDAHRPVVRVAGRGVYRILLPGLTPQARRRVVLRVTAGPATAAEASKAPFSSALVVRTSDRQTGAPAARDFTLVVYGSRRDVPPRPLPKTT